MATQFAVDLVFKSKGMGALNQMNKQLDAAKGKTLGAKNGIVSFDRAAKGAAGSAKGAAVATKGLGAAIGAALGPIIGITAALGAIGKSFSVFQERQADVATLTQGLKKFGLDGADAIAVLNKQADEFGKKTLFNQEDFTKAAVQLTSFTGIAVKEYDRVINIAGDVAQVMGQDVASATTQLAKALNDPTQNLTALSRSGIQFTEVQKEQIKALQESGQLMQAQEIILKELERQYGGAAEAAGSAGLAGALDSIGETANDMFEKVGGLMDMFAAPILEVFGHQLERVNEWWAYLGQEILPQVQAALAPVWEQLEALANDLDFDSVQDFVQNVLITGMQHAISVLTEVSKVIAGFIQKMREMANNPAVRVLVDAFNKLVNAMGLGTNHMQEFRDKQAAAAEAAEGALDVQEQVTEAVKSSAEAAKELKRAQTEVTKAIQEAAKAADAQAAADKQALSFKFELLNEELKTKGVLLKIDQERAQRALDAAKNEAEKIEAAKQVYDLAIKQAKLEREIAQAAIDQAVQQAEVALRSAQLKERELAAVVHLAEAQGAVTAEHYKALQAQREAVGIADRALEQAYALTEQQGKQADALYRAQVEAAKAAYEQDKVWKATEGAAAAAGTFASNMQAAAAAAAASAKNFGIGAGTRTSGSITLQGSSEAIQKALQHSRIGTLGEDGRYHIDWNRLAQLRQVGSGPLSAPGALDELRESIKHWEEVLRQNAERAAARSQVEADRLARFQAHQSQAGQVRVSVQTSGASVVRLNDDDYLRKDAAADMASRAATEAKRSVLNDLQRSSSTRLSVGLR